MFKQLQEDHKIWALENFGEQDVEDYKLGMIEEVGELAHSVLKRKQGIRNNEDHDALIKDAVGDIAIYLVGYCNCFGFHLDGYHSMFWKHKVNVITISRSINNLIDRNGNQEIALVFNQLRLFCNQEGFDFEQTVLDTWKNVVSKRDWVNNPNQCETEDPRYQGFPV